MKNCNCFITFNIPSFFCVPGSIFRDCLGFFFKFKSTWADPYNIIDTCTNSVCTIYITNLMCTNLYLHSACIWVIFKKMKTLCDIEGEISNWTNWHNFGSKIMSIWYIFQIQLLSAIYEDKKKIQLLLETKC